LSRSQGICAAYVGANLPSTLALGKEAIRESVSVAEEAIQEAIQ